MRLPPLPNTEVQPNQLLLASSIPGQATVVMRLGEIDRSERGNRPLAMIAEP